MKNVFFIFTTVMIIGCAGEKTEATPSLEVSHQSKQSADDQEDKNMITITGTVVFKQLEGGFYGLDADDGKKYLPQGMKKSLLKNGMKVRVKGYILTDMLTFQQYGEVLKVIETEMIDDSQVHQQNEY